MLVRVRGKDSETVTAALKKQITTLPRKARQSLTWDRGTETARHKEFSVATEIKVYFCDPHSPAWHQREHKRRRNETSALHNLTQLANRCSSKRRRGIAFGASA